MSPARLALSWFGAGYAKKAPGTVGSLFAIPYGLIILNLTDSGWWLAGAAIVVTLLGVWLCERTLISDDHDPSWVVLDEVAGQWLAMSFLPFTGYPLDAPGYVLAYISYIVLSFALFRLFDILKPWPVSIPDTKMTGGWGVMLDDVLAGLMAGGLGWGIVWAFNAYV